MYSPATWVLTLLTWSEKSTLQHVLHFLHGHLKAHFLIKTAIRLTKLAFLSSLRGPTDGWPRSEVSPWQKKSSRGLRPPPGHGMRPIFGRTPLSPGAAVPAPGAGHISSSSFLRPLYSRRLRVACYFSCVLCKPPRPLHDPLFGRNLAEIWSASVAGLGTGLVVMSVALPVCLVVVSRFSAENCAYTL